MIKEIKKHNKEQFVHIDSIHDKIAEAKEYVKGDNKRELDKLSKELQAHKQAIDNFEKHSGIKIKTWNDNKKIGDVVRFIESGGCDSVEKQLRGLQTTAELVLNKITHVLNNMPAQVTEIQGPLFHEVKIFK